MTRWCVAMLAVMSWFSTSAVAQSTSRLDRARDRSKPRRSAADEARRRRQNDLIDADRIRGDIRSRGLLRSRAGHYVCPPDRYRADNWSPRFRPRYDYRGSRFSWDRGRRRYSPRRRFDSHYPRRRYGYGSSRSSRYDRDYGYPYGSYRDDHYTDAYKQGHYDANHEYGDYIFAERAARLLDANREKLDEGMSFFRAGNYGRAAVAWLGASKLNEADAASRVHAGHALFALGRYTDAVNLLSRGFELAPILAQSTYDIRTDYTDQSDFTRHLATLKGYVAKHPNDVEAMTLLGYVLSHSRGPASAYAVLNRARALRPKDAFIEKLWETTKAVSPQDGVDTNEGRSAQEPDAPGSNAPKPKASESDAAKPMKGADRTAPIRRRASPVKRVRMVD